jgi:hypothetical protein
MRSKLFVGCPQHLVVILSYRLQNTVTDIAQHTPYHQGFSVTGYIRTGTDVKQTEVADCELTDLINDLPPDLTWFPHNFEMLL